MFTLDLHHIFQEYRFSLTYAQESELLTPEEAYLRFKKLLKQFKQSAKECEK